MTYEPTPEDVVKMIRDRVAASSEELLAANTIEGLLKAKARIDPSRYTRSLRARRLRGAAALMEMLAMIGAGGKDGDVAKLLVDQELELRELLSFALSNLAAATDGEQGECR